MNTLEKKALEKIDLDGLLAFLGELTAIKSLDGSSEENQAQKHVAAFMRTINLEVDEWEINFEALKKHPAYSAEVERNEGLGVTGCLGKANGPSLILNGHVDVVPAENENLWVYPPWQASIHDGKVYGRGSLDMKGGLCCALFAAKAIQDAGIQLKGKLILESVIGEEDGGAGTLACVLRGYRADAAVIMEPTNLVISPSQAGALNFRVTIQGKTAHGAVRSEGVSAIEKFILIHQALTAFEKERNEKISDPLFRDYDLPIPLNIGNIQGGDWASNVPEKLVFEGRFGIAANEDPEKAKKDFENRLQKAAAEDSWLADHPPKVEWWGGQFEPAETPLDSPIISILSKAFAELHGKEPVQRGVTYGADMRLLVNYARTPTLLFGPGDIRYAHQPDEFVPIEDLLSVTRTLVLTALRFCGAEETTTGNES
jgi:acetylornithine deacetylase